MEEVRVFGLRVPVAVVIVGCGMAWESAAVSGSAAFVTDGRGECVAVCLTTARCDERINDSIDDRGQLGRHVIQQEARTSHHCSSFL